MAIFFSSYDQCCLPSILLQYKNLLPGSFMILIDMVVFMIFFFVRQFHIIMNTIKYRWTLLLLLNENKNATIRHKTCKFPEYLSKGQEWQEGIMLLHNVFETPTLALVCIMDMTSCSFLMQSCVQGYYDKCDIKIYKTLPIWPRARTLFIKM